MEILVNRDGSLVRVLVPDQCGLGSDPTSGIMKELLSGLILWFIPIVAPQFIILHYSSFQGKPTFLNILIWFGRNGQIATPYTCLSQAANSQVLVWLTCTHVKEGFTQFLSYFFVKKIPLSQRVGYVMGGWISEWISGSVDQWAMYVCHTNQIRSTIRNQSNFLL